MSRLEDPLVLARVIGDVLDMFVPLADLAVYYGDRQIGNGCDIKPSMSAESPWVRVTASRDKSTFFTLVMVDPDAPSPSDPTLREWLHWMVVNIPGGGDATEGEEMAEYMGPKPPTGIHRYVFVVFEQEGEIEELKGIPVPVPVERRHNFSTRQFAADNGLGLPVAAVYFNAHREPNPYKRR